MTTNRIQHNKLVRNKVPDVLRALGHTFEHDVLNEDGYLDALLDKLVEEATEANKVSSTADLVAELGDLLDVIDALCDFWGIQAVDVMRARVAKHDARGGFDKGYFLNWVEEPEPEPEPTGTRPATKQHT